MLITKKFVVLNLPKTGSSYVRQVIKSIYHNRIRNNLFLRALGRFNLINKGYVELMMPHPHIPGYKDQHGAYFQIPEGFRNRSIVSAVRNPFERFESAYKFKWWAKNPPLDSELIKERFPSFPDISINEYLEMRKITTERIKKRWGVPLDVPIGDQTLQFIRMYFKQPFKVFPKISIEYLESEDFLNEMADVRFFRQENLNEDLAGFLSEMGFHENEVSFAREHQRVNVTEGDKRNGGSLLNPWIIDYIREHERYLLKLLAVRGLDYHI